MRERLVVAFWALARSLDIFVCTWFWLAPLYVFGLADRPSGRQMISCYVGNAAMNGMRWAIRAAAIIDWLACKVGDKPNHCSRSYLRYKGKED